MDEFCVKGSRFIGVAMKEGEFSYLDRKISYRLQGRGRPIVFIHGFAGSKEDFSGVARRLSKNYTCLSYDLVGHGLSSSQGDYSLDGLAQDLAELLAYLNIKEPVLVGFSLGGQLALDYLLNWGQARGLILVDTSPRLLKGDAAKLGIYSQEEVDRTLSLMEEDFHLFYRGFLRRILGETSEKNLDFLMEKRGPVLEKLYKPGLALLWRDMTKKDYSSRLSELELDCLIIRGEKSFYPRRIAEFFQENIRGSRLVEFENSSHQLILEKPRSFQKEIEGFMESLK